MPDTPLNPDAIHLDKIKFARGLAALELAELCPEEAEYSEISQMVEAVLSGWLKVFPMQPAVAQPEVNSVEELDQLPAGSYVQGWDGFKHAKDWNGGWHLIVNRPSSAPHLSGSIELPARVLYRPTEETTNGR